MYRNRNSVQIGLSLIEPVCTLSFLLITFPSVDCFRCRLHCWVQGLKGERFSGWILSAGGRFCPKRLVARPFNFQTWSVLPLQTSLGNGRLTELKYWLKIEPSVLNLFLTSRLLDLSHSCFLAFSYAVRPTCCCVVRYALRYAVLQCVSLLSDVLELELMHSVLL